MATTSDIALTIVVPISTTNATPLLRSERRITPAWTITQLKAKLEPITGIPSSSQSIRFQSISGDYISLAPDTAQVSEFLGRGLTKGIELEVLDGRPPGVRENFTDVSGVEKYEMPADQYEKLDDSVLAWKKKRGLGRFDPNAKSLEEVVVERRERDWNVVKGRGMDVGVRCRVNGSDERRGVVKFIGEVEGLGGEREKGCVWVGVEFDEPVGRNDGSVDVEAQENVSKKRIEKRRVFETKGEKYGGLVRPEVIEVGEKYGVLDDLHMGSDMEEI